MCLLVTMLDSANENISVTPESSTGWHWTRGYFTDLIQNMVAVVVFLILELQ